MTVTGQGCFYSTVLAGRCFLAPNGIFRGGLETVEWCTISARVFGGPTGIVSKVTLLKGGRITASRVHPNVVVCIGQQSYKIDETASQVKEFLHEGKIKVYSSSHKIH